MEVDFFLSQADPGQGPGQEELPLAWSMNVDIVPLCFQSINPMVELLQCLEPGATKVIKVTD